jgi:hypothetical protein
MELKVNMRNKLVTVAGRCWSLGVWRTAARSIVLAGRLPSSRGCTGGGAVRLRIGMELLFS